MDQLEYEANEGRLFGRGSRARKTVDYSEMLTEREWLKVHAHVKYYNDKGIHTFGNTVCIYYHYVCCVIACRLEGVWQLCKVSSNSRPMYTV